MKDVKKDIMWRIYIVYFVVLILAISVIGRIIYIQTAEDEIWEAKSKNQSIKKEKISAIRGNIYSHDYSLLATSVPMFNLFWDATTVKEEVFHQNVDQLAVALHNEFPDESVSAIKNKLHLAYKKGKRYQKIRLKVEYSQLKRIKKMPIFKEGKFKGGLIIEEYARRKRPYKMLAMRTIGMYNTSTKKYTVGLEGAFDQFLKGEDGMRLKQKTTGGWKPLHLIDETIKEPRNGDDIVTTIDINIQDVAENSLYDELERNDADWGTAILMEVKTGAIKAIVNLSKDSATDTYVENFNHAIGTAVEPGSTFKLPSMMVALQEKTTTMDEMTNTGNGYFTYRGATIKDSDHGGYGTISTLQIFEKSSNVGVFKVLLKGFEGQPQKFIDRLYDYGLNEKLGLQIKGEANPYIKDTKDKYWSKLSLPFMSIGYELKLTALQILTFYNAVANNGKMVKPMFVKEIQRTGIPIKIFKTEVLKDQIATPEVIRYAQQMCEGVVQNGTGKLLKGSPFRAAGKTGTAQIYTTTYDNTSYRASFAGYFPADNPRYSCIVVVSNPKKGLYYASQIAVPVFKDIADKIYSMELDMHPDRIPDTVFIAPASKVGDFDDINNVYARLNFGRFIEPIDGQYGNRFLVESRISGQARIINENQMPNLVGMNSKDAIFIIEQLGLKVSIEGKGKVASQSINEGTAIKKGIKVHLILSV